MGLARAARVMVGLSPGGGCAPRASEVCRAHATAGRGVRHLPICPPLGRAQPGDAVVTQAISWNEDTGAGEEEEAEAVCVGVADEAAGGN